MGSFDAATAVEQLDYDFTKYGGGKGDIPEPTTGQLASYFNEIRDIAGRARELQAAAKKMSEAQADDTTEDSVSDDEAQEIIAAMDKFSLEEFQHEMSSAVARLCSDSPSEEQLAKLPYRVLQAFIKWISGEFRPEKAAAATK
jgi:hypothetical protein